MADLAAAMYVLAALAGVGAGIVTGLLPGLHANTAAVLAASVFYAQRMSDNLAVSIFILSLSISHVFHEFLPSVFLGFSESEAALAVLPGHRMLFRGEGRKAVLLSALGGMAGVLGVVLLSPILMLALKLAFSATKGFIAVILAAAVAFYFYKTRRQKKVAVDVLVLLLAGAFGVSVFGLPTVREPLLPMLSGLFGVSSLIGGLLKSSSMPLQQEKAAVKTKKLSKIFRLFAAGIFSSSLVGLFPALGPAQAAMLGTAAFKKLKPSSYMFILGVISSASMLLGLLTLYSFGKARNGSIAVIGNILPPSAGAVILLLAVAVVSASVSFVTVAFISRPFTLMVRKADYSLISKAVIVLICLLVILFSGIAGLLVLAVATAIGMIPVLAKSGRQMLMGCLMVPVMLYYV